MWADTLTLGYERSELGEGMWTVTPLVVYSLDAHEARIADRADVPLVVASECLDEELVALTGDSARAQLTDGERGELYDEIAGLVGSIADVEESAVARLRDAMS